MNGETEKIKTQNIKNEDLYLNALVTHKDRVFRMVFKEKQEFLELYNAMNGTSYTNPEDLEVTTLENAIYMGLKNDVSFLLYDELALYEHQSTDNPNMPLRNLFYVADIYSKLTAKANLYGSRLVKIPEPKFVVFYNGTDELPERSELRLSDAFEKKSESMDLELKVLVLNINPGYNEELMEKCKSLRDYMIFVSRIREYSQHMALNKAVEISIQTCIDEDILAEFLRKNRAEVLKVSIYEYNEALHIQQEREAAREDGLQQGMQQGLQRGALLERIGKIRRKSEKGLPAGDIADMLEEESAFVERVLQIFKEQPDMDAEKACDILIRGI
ncbi:hypothetical protein [Frisingicoccus sp.]|uniref:hypothetical protein n=1 Tax=Frisingicoccus sp. TaxID=1918627 RepID=UPI003AB6BE32